MHNPLITECDRLALQGYHPEAVFVMPVSSGVWQGLIICRDFVHPLEGVLLRAEGLPKTISVSGWERVPDKCFGIEADRPQIAAWMTDLARYGDAIDWAYFEGTGDYLTKPNRWIVPPTIAQKNTPLRPSQIGKMFNPEKDDGRKAGSKRRKKHQARGTYPEPGIPVEREDKTLDWIRACQSGYYQQLANTGDKINQRTAIEHMGLRIAAAGFEVKLLDAWADEIDSLIEGADDWTIVSGQSHYTAATPFEAVILMLLDR
jgi:hypothetical protein